MLMAKQMELCRLTRRAYSRRMDQDDLVHLEHREARRAYGMLIDKAKRGHWDGFLLHTDMHQGIPRMEGGPGYPHSEVVRPAMGQMKGD